MTNKQKNNEEDLLFFFLFYYDLYVRIELTRRRILRCYAALKKKFQVETSGPDLASEGENKNSYHDLNFLRCIDQNTMYMSQYISYLILTETRITFSSS